MGTEDRAWINKLILVLEEFRKINQNVTANQIVTFLNIARQPGITQRALSEAVGLNDGTVSRICALLSERGLGEQRGAEIIEIVPLPGDYRIRGQRLSAKGRRVITTIRETMIGTAD